MALEPLALAHAAENFSEEDAAIATDALRRHVRAYRHGAPAEASAAHTEFYNATNSRWLTRLITPLGESSERYRPTLPPRYRPALEEPRAEHERILARCVARDAGTAARELHDHLAVTANRVARRMGADEDLFGARPARRRRAGDRAKPRRRARRRTASLTLDQASVTSS